MSFLDEAKRRIALAGKAKSAQEPDSKERAFRKGMAAVLENIDAVDEKLVQEMMVVLMDNLERSFGGKQPAEQQPATNTRHGPETPDINTYFTEPANKLGNSKAPNINSYFY